MRLLGMIGWAVLIMMAVIACILIGALISAIGLLLPYVIPGAVVLMFLVALFSNAKPPDKQ